jgi:hypothetical protein
MQFFSEKVESAVPTEAQILLSLSSDGQFRNYYYQ